MMDHGGEGNPVRYAQLGEHLPEAGVHGVRPDGADESCRRWGLGSQGPGVMLAGMGGSAGVAWLSAGPCRLLMVRLSVA